jgi:hypothetical protein
VSGELAFERSGPERYLSSTQLLLEMLDAADPDDARQAVELGRDGRRLRDAAADVARGSRGCSRVARTRRWPQRW